MNTHITHSELKRAKKMVMKTHPDKSGLKSEVFEFFSKAFELLVYVYGFQNKSHDMRDTYDVSVDETHDIKLLKFSDLSVKDKTKFNKTFNALFENIYVKTDEERHGYEDLLKSQHDPKSSYSLQKQKLVHNTLAISETPEGLGTRYNNITRTKPSSYSSEVFSKMAFEDVKTSQDECVIPIDESALNHRKRFDSVDELKRDRAAQNIQPMKDSAGILCAADKRSEEESMARAYELVKQSMQVEERKKIAMRSLNLLS